MNSPQDNEIYEEEEEDNPPNQGYAHENHKSGSVFYIPSCGEPNQECPAKIEIQDQVKNEDNDFVFQALSDSDPEDDLGSRKKSRHGFRERRKLGSKKTRTNYDKWTPEEKRTFWFGHMQIIRNHPLIEHSWKHWKVDGCFKKMQPMFNEGKTHRQIKSFDQRMKLTFIKKGMDIPEAIIHSLNQQRSMLSSPEIEKLEDFIRWHQKKINGEQMENDENEEPNQVHAIFKEDDWGQNDKEIGKKLGDVIKNLIEINQISRTDGFKISEIHRAVCCNDHH